MKCAENPPEKVPDVRAWVARQEAGYEDGCLGVNGVDWKI
jgi:hypothetical protein